MLFNVGDRVALASDTARHGQVRAIIPDAGPYQHVVKLDESNEFIILIAADLVPEAVWEVGKSYTKLPGSPGSPVWAVVYLAADGWALGVLEGAESPASTLWFNPFTRALYREA